uniref:Uncharacterized protein n=1 Tax=Romanomermis culicivorax TaxID=13658 RepID=A0A915INV2_ROMCU
MSFFRPFRPRRRCHQRRCR